MAARVIGLMTHDPNHPASPPSGTAPQAGKLKMRMTLPDESTALQLSRVVDRQDEGEAVVGEVLGQWREGGRLADRFQDTAVDTR